MVGLDIKSGMNRAGGGNASPGEFNSALFLCAVKKGCAIKIRRVIHPITPAVSLLKWSNFSALAAVKITIEYSAWKGGHIFAPPYVC